MAAEAAAGIYGEFCLLGRSDYVYLRGGINDSE